MNAPLNTDPRQAMHSICPTCAVPVPVQHLSRHGGQCPQCRRRARSAAARSDYRWSHLPDGRAVVDTGEKAYIVSSDACSCPDWAYRCAHTGMQCKHQIALQMRGETR